MTLARKPNREAQERAFLLGASSEQEKKRHFQMRVDCEFLRRVDAARAAAYQSRTAYIIAAVRAQLDREGY